MAGFDDLDLGALRARRNAKWSTYDADVLAAWVAEMDFALAPPIAAAIADAVRREQFGYPLADHATGLPEACAAYQRRTYGFDVDPTRVHLAPDVLRAIALGIEAFSAPGSAVIITTPAYMPFLALPGAVGRAIIEVPMRRREDRGTFDLEAIDAAFAAGAGTLICCNPYNPLGLVFSAAELAELAEVVEARRGRVISDEIHAPLTYPGARHVPYATASVLAAGHSLTVTAASKAWNLPGLRCAQVITHNDADEAVWRAIPPLRIGSPSTLGIVAGLASYGEGGQWLSEVLAYLDGNRRLVGELVASELGDGATYRVPDATYLAWIDCRGLGLDEEPADFFLARARVAMNAGRAFGAPGTGHVRFNFATSRALIERMFTQMGEALRRR